MPYSVKGFFEINEDMVQILLMLEVLFTHDSKVEDLFCDASSGTEPSLFFSNYFFSLGFKPIQDSFLNGGQFLKERICSRPMGVASSHQE